MPYPRAHYYLLLLIPLVGLAFWPGYFSRLDEAPLAFHLHGITASLWMLLLITQSWAIHGRRRALHRALGRTSIVLVPLFLVGGFLVLKSMSQQTYGEHPFFQVFGAGLGLIDLLAVLFFAAFYAAALRYRRRVQLHARYMIATILLLTMPIGTRVLNAYVPGFRIEGPEDMYLFAVALHLSNAVGLLFALGLYLQDRAHGRPFLLVMAFMAASGIGFQWLAEMAPWQGLFRLLGELPSGAMVLLGLVLAAGALWRGLGGAPPSAGPFNPRALKDIKKPTEVSIF